jgi:cytoskeleton protein RodZ
VSKAKIIESTDVIEENSIKDGKVGTMLHDVRTKKKIDIDDVAKNLRIKKAYLIAIEESDYENIPEAPYGVGFVRSYASFLGLNSARIVQLFKEETQQIVEPAIAPEEPAKSTNEGAKELINNIESYIPNRKYILVSFGMFLLLYVIWGAFSTDTITEEDADTTAIVEQEDNDFPVQVETYAVEEENENGTAKEEDPQINITEKSFIEDEPQPENKAVATEEQNKKETEKEVQKKEPADTQTVSDNEKKSEEKPAVAKKTGRVVLKIKKETWIEVKDENKLWISKVLKAGDEYVLPENGVGKTVSFGNTDGVDVLIDGKAVTIISNNKKTNIKMDPFLGNH